MLRQRLLRATRELRIETADWIDIGFEGRDLSGGKTYLIASAAYA